LQASDVKYAAKTAEAAKRGSVCGTRGAFTITAQKNPFLQYCGRLRQSV